MIIIESPCHSADLGYAAENVLDPQIMLAKLVDAVNSICWDYQRKF